MQDGKAAFPLDRIVARTDRVLAGHVFRIRDDIAQALARDRLRVEIDEIAKLRQQFRHTTGVVEMLHIVLAGRLEIDQHRYLAADLVEHPEIEPVRRAMRHRGEMDQAVGRAADRLEHDLARS
ncbi:hypothetical protein ACVWW5_005901 [Bradyrhizobium sp. LM3.4]